MYILNSLPALCQRFEECWSYWRCRHLWCNWWWHRDHRGPLKSIGSIVIQHKKKLFHVYFHLPSSILMPFLLSFILRDVEIVEVFNSNTVSQTDSADSIGQTNSLVIEPEETTISTYDSLPTSSTLQLNKQSGLSLEDPMKMMDSILNESGAISQNINLLGK